MDFIPFALHEINDDDVAEVVDTLRSNWITSGPKVKQFEKNFSEYIGSKHALAVNSATAGLHLALEAIGLGVGDKVITTPYTFTATVEVIRYFDADPLFIDIKQDDYNIDSQKIRSFCRDQCVVKNNTLYHKETNALVKAIIPVHIGGYPCDMDEIMDIARKYHLRVIEDAAHALPSYYHGEKIGTISDMCVFSFYPTKAMTTGEGGMVVTNNDDYYDRVKLMRLHGITRDSWDRSKEGEFPNWYYEVLETGFKYNMTDIAASLGLQQLRKVDQFYEKRKRIARIYHDEFRHLNDIDIPDINKKGHSWHLYIIKLNSKRISRDDFIKKLNAKGVGTSVHFIPLHIHPYYKNKYTLSPEDFPVAYDCYKKVVSLPIYSKLTDEEIKEIVTSIKELVT